jgi:hypothetical protein
MPSPAEQTSPFAAILATQPESEQGTAAEQVDPEPVGEA